MAAIHGHYKVVDYLIEKGANIDHQNHNGETALFIVAGSEHTDVVELLLNKGANANLRTVHGHTAYDAAKQNMYNLYLLKPHDQQNVNILLMNACQFKNEKQILSFHEKGVGFFIENDKGETAFSILERKGALSPRLQSLKEKLAMEQLLDDDICLNRGI